MIKSDEAAVLLESEEVTEVGLEEEPGLVDEQAAVTPAAPDGPERSARLREDAAALRAEIVQLMSAPEGLLFDLASLRADLQAAKERATVTVTNESPGADAGAGEDLDVAEEQLTPRRGFFGLRKRR